MPDPFVDGAEGRHVPQVVAAHDDDPGMRLLLQFAQGIILADALGLELDDLATFLGVQIVLVGHLVTQWGEDTPCRPAVACPPGVNRNGTPLVLDMCTSEPGVGHAHLIDALCEFGHRSTHLWRVVRNDQFPTGYVVAFHPVLAQDDEMMQLRIGVESSHLAHGLHRASGDDRAAAQRCSNVADGVSTRRENTALGGIGDDGRQRPVKVHGKQGGLRFGSDRIHDVLTGTGRGDPRARSEPHPVRQGDDVRGLS